MGALSQEIQFNNLFLFPCVGVGEPHSEDYSAEVTCWFLFSKRKNLVLLEYVHETNVFAPVFFASFTGHLIPFRSIKLR